MPGNDCNEQKRQDVFSLLVNAGRGGAELIAECRKCGAIHDVWARTAAGFKTSLARSAERLCA